MIWKMIDLAAGLPIITSVPKKSDAGLLYLMCCQSVKFNDVACVWWKGFNEPEMYIGSYPNARRMWLSTYCREVALRAAMKLIQELMHHLPHPDSTQRKQMTECKLLIRKRDEYIKNPVVRGILQEGGRNTGKAKDWTQIYEERRRKNEEE